MTDLKLSEAASQEQAKSMREELAHVTELAVVNNERVASVLSEMDGLREDLKGLQSVKDRTLEADVIRQELATHRASIMELEAPSDNSASIQRLETDLAALRDRLDAITSSVDQEHSVEVEGMRQDEEQELRAQERIFARIDELCERLAVVDRAMAAAVAAEPDAPTARAAQSELRSATGVTGRGIPAEFAEEFETLVSRVEDMRNVEQQIEAKFEEFTDQMHVKLGYFASSEALGSQARGGRDAELPLE